MQYMNSNEGFLGIENCKIEKTNAIIIPFGLESTVSYGLGTSKGPEEIIKASHQLELYDEDLDYEPYRRIHSPLDCCLWLRCECTGRCSR